MQKADIRKQWEGAAPGWAKWEATVASWIAPATTAMLDLANISPVRAYSTSQAERGVRR